MQEIQIYELNCALRQVIRIGDMSHQAARCSKRFRSESPLQARGSFTGLHAPVAQPSIPDDLRRAPLPSAVLMASRQSAHSAAAACLTRSSMISPCERAAVQSCACRCCLVESWLHLLEILQINSGLASSGADASEHVEMLQRPHFCNTSHHSRSAGQNIWVMDHQLSKG